MKHRVLGLFLLSCSMFFVPQAVMAADETYVADHTDVARDYMAAQQWSYASFEWRNVLDKDPQNLEANIGLAQSLIESGYPEDAVAQLEKARVSNPSSQLAEALAKLYIRTQAYGKAAQVYQSMLKADPSDAKAFRMLTNVSQKLSPQNQDRVSRFLAEQAQIAKSRGYQAVQSQKYKEAAANYALVAAGTPKVRDLNDYGLALLLSGEPKLASDQFVRLYRVGKTPWQSLANMAVVATAMNRNDSADRFIQEAIGKCSDPLMKAKLYNIWGYAMEMGRNMTRAQFAYGKAVALDPSLTKARMNLGYVLQRDRQFNKAAQTFQDLIKLQPNNAEAWNQLGFTWELARQYHQAETAYKKAMALSPNLREAYFNLGTLYKKQGELDKATEVFKTLNEQEFFQVEGGKPLSNQADAVGVDLTSLIDVFFLSSASSTSTPVVQKNRPVASVKRQPSVAPNKTPSGQP